MKKLLPLLCFLLSAFVGCNNKLIDQDNSLNTKCATWAGTWADESGMWKLNFNDKGELVTFKHPFGVEIDVSEGGGSKEYAPDKWGVFYLGSNTTQFNDLTNELTVNIWIEYFRIPYLAGVMEGQSKDKIVGTISKDGKELKGKWFTIGSKADTGELDINNAASKELILNKIIDE